MIMAEHLPQPPLLRRMPGGFVGFVDGLAWPVDDPQGAAEWPGTRWRLDGERLIAEAAPGAGPPPAGPQTTPIAAAPLPRRAAVAQHAMPGMRLLRGAAEPLVVPRAWLERVLPWPEPQPLAFAPPGVLGLAVAGAAVLVLDGPRPQSLLAVLRVEDRLVGLGCGELRPDSAPGDAAWLPEGALALAPRAPPATPRLEEPSQALLFCQAGGTRFALPALEVEAVMPPQLPVPAPMAGRGHAHIVAHRGQVLPVLDAGLALGGAPVLGGGEVPMLRLAGLAVAVAVVEGLRRVPLSAISPATSQPGADGAMRAVCWPAGLAVPVLEPAWLARGA